MSLRMWRDYCKEFADAYRLKGDPTEVGTWGPKYRLCGHMSPQGLEHRHPVGQGLDLADGQSISLSPSLSI